MVVLLAQCWTVLTGSKPPAKRNQNAPDTLQPGICSPAGEPPAKAPPKPACSVAGRASPLCMMQLKNPFGKFLNLVQQKVQQFLVVRS